MKCNRVLANPLCSLWEKVHLHMTHHQSKQCLASRLSCGRPLTPCQHGWNGHSCSWHGLARISPPSKQWSDVSCFFFIRQSRNKSLEGLVHDTVTLYCSGSEGPHRHMWLLLFALSSIRAILNGDYNWNGAELKKFKYAPSHLLLTRILMWVWNTNKDFWLAIVVW